LAGTDPQIIVASVKNIINNLDKIMKRLLAIENPYGDGTAATKIVSIIERFLSHELDDLRISEPDLRETPYVKYLIKERSDITNNDEILAYVISNKELSFVTLLPESETFIVRSKIKIKKPWED